MWGKVCPNRAEQSTATTSLIPGFKQGENAICPSQSWQEYPNPTTQYHLLLMKVRSIKKTSAVRRMANVSMAVLEFDVQNDFKFQDVRYA